MQVKTVGQGPHPDFSINASIVTVAGIAIDAEARQGEGQSVIDIRQSGGVAQEGGAGYQLATIVIPPREYIQVDDEAATGEEGEDSTTREPVPLDTRRVQVTIWPAI